MLIKKVVRYLDRQFGKADKFKDEIQRLSKIPRYTPGASHLFGVEFSFVDATTLIGGYAEIIRKQVYEFKSSRPDPLIIDCGANIGLSIYYFKMLYPQAKIKAFEPDPVIFKTLEKNIKTLEFMGVELHQEAIWKDNGTLEFQIEGGFSGRIPKEGDTENLIRVPCRRLKDLLKESIDFLKIDIEGAEFEVLTDIRGDLSCVQNIFIEYHSHIKERQTLGEILEVLQQAGFRYHIQEAYAHKKPFVERDTMLGMDLQLNIFGYRDFI
ncbi:FkbM family methyltransferase [Chryseolinea sp. H1M3-3]|uniref:FkbM family methyltransferase n=1 Tax=Chryseolinea sp. H1M3-3 TaxID=3034144 RepID=UPI0023EC4286|nr:FkbM family methyltransferase [Chryseolinea sp. H1M3-3]